LRLTAVAIQSLSKGSATIISDRLRE
jgi:hypothetical protein